MFNLLPVFDFSSVKLIVSITSLTFLFKYLFSLFEKDKRLQKFSDTLPGPPTIPLIGNGLDFYFSGPRATKKILSYSEKYGSVFRLWFGKHLVIGLTDAEDLEVVFRSSKLLGKSEAFKAFMDIWGDGLFTGPTHIWKKTRKIYQPLFTNNALPKYVDVFNSKIYQTIDEMKKLIDGGDFDSWDYMPFLSFSIITKTSLNVEVNSEDATLLKFHNLVKRGMEVSLLRMLKPWYHVKFIYNFLLKQKVDTIRKKMQHFSESIVKNEIPKLKNDLQKLKNFHNADNINGLFLKLANKYQSNVGNEKIMHDEIITMITGGTDTIAITNSFFLLAVASKPEIQDKLFEEISKVFHNSDRMADFYDLDNLPYLDKVLKETLRRFPIVPVMFRQVEEDVYIQSRLFPSGSEIMVSIIGVHFDPKYYENPFQFNPENFSDDAVKLRPRHAYLPFSAGPRNCIGNTYAILEIKLTLIALLRAYRFHTNIKIEEVPLNMGFLLTSSIGYKVNIKKR